jgi:hypothetical protein
MDVDLLTPPDAHDVAVALGVIHSDEGARGVRARSKRDEAAQTAACVLLLRSWPHDLDGLREGGGETSGGRGGGEIPLANYLRGVGRTGIGVRKGARSRGVGVHAQSGGESVLTWMAPKRANWL